MKNLKVCASFIAISLLSSVSPGWGTLAYKGDHGSAPPPTQRPAFSLTLNPTSVTGGNNVSGTVTRTAEPASQVVIVSLSSSDPRIVLVPPTVQIEVGRANASFMIRTVAVSIPYDVNISASVPLHQTQTVSLRVLPYGKSPGLSLVLPPSVPGGKRVSGTVSLPSPAGSNGAVVALSSTNQAVAPVPGFVQIPAGASQVDFDVTTLAVADVVDVSIRASYANQSKTAPLRVVPVALSLVLNEPSVLGGRRTSGTVSLSSPADSNGAVVALSSTNQAVAAVPGFVQIPAGASQVGFGVTTVAVANPVDVSIRASYANQIMTAPLKVLCPPLSLRLDRSTVVGGESVEATVKLSDPQSVAPSGGLPLKCSVPAASGSTVIDVTIPAGNHERNFVVHTHPVAQPMTYDLRTVYACCTSGGTLCGGTGPYPPLTVLPPRMFDLVFNPATASYRAGTVDVYVKLNGAAPSGTSVLLSWTSTTAETVPPSVPVPAGASSVSFKVNLEQVTAPTPFTLSAYYLGVTKSATLTVNP